MKHLQWIDGQHWGCGSQLPWLLFQNFQNTFIIHALKEQSGLFSRNYMTVLSKILLLKNPDSSRWKKIGFFYNDERHVFLIHWLMFIEYSRDGLMKELRFIDGPMQIIENIFHKGFLGCRKLTCFRARLSELKVIFSTCLSNHYSHNSHLLLVTHYNMGL